MPLRSVYLSPLDFGIIVNLAKLEYKCYSTFYTGGVSRKTPFTAQHKAFMTGGTRDNALIILILYKILYGSNS